MESVNVRSGSSAEYASAKQAGMNTVFNASSDSGEGGCEVTEAPKTASGTERDVGENNKVGFFPLNAMEFVMALGLGLYFALLQVNLNGEMLFVQSLHIDLAFVGFVELLGSLSFCLAISLCWRNSDFVSGLPQNRVCIAGSAILAALVLVQGATSVVAEDAWMVLVPIEVACGVANGILFVIWIAGIWGLQRSAAVRVMFLALCVAAASAALIAAVQTPLIRYLVMAVCLILSGLCYLAACPSAGEVKIVSRGETRQSLKFDMRTSVSLFIIAVAHGFCMSLIVDFGDASFIVIAASFVLAALFVGVGVIFFGDRGVLLGTIFRCMSPVLVVGFTCMIFATGWALGVCAVLALGVCFTCMISLFVTLVQLKLRFKVQPVYACSRVLMPWAWGAMFGLIASLVKLGCAAQFGDSTLAVFAAFVVVFLSISTAIAPYGIDMLTMPIEPEDEANEAEDESHELHAWKTACEAIASEGGLTPREKDVFMLLAKGRNAKVIERELFISIYTIKGHNNSIYRKLGVKSQQELIDLVEHRKYDIWKPSIGTEQGGKHE